jgi:hypothetical protein
VSRKEILDRVWNYDLSLDMPGGVLRP